MDDVLKENHDTVPTFLMRSLLQDVPLPHQEDTVIAHDEDVPHPIDDIHVHAYPTEEDPPQNDLPRNDPQDESPHDDPAQDTQDDPAQDNPAQDGHLQEYIYI